MGKMDAERDNISERYYYGIDVIALIFYILKRSFLIVIAAAIGAYYGRYYATHKITPIYQATSKIYIAGSDTGISIYDLQLGSTLATDYQEIIKIRDIHAMVAEKLGLNYNYNWLANNVSVRIPSKSHVMYIYMKSDDPEEAMVLANTYAEVMQDYISERMELQRPLLLETARKPTSPISPNVNTITKDYAVIGGFIPGCFLVLLYLINDRIRSADDVTNAVNLPVFGSLPIQHFGEKGKGADASDHSSPIVRDKQNRGQKETPQAVISNIPPVDYPYSESMHGICTEISFAGNGLKAIAVTSSGQDEGKTFTALQMSICFANRGEKTVLIDCDLRKSVMQNRYGIQLSGKGVGLAHLLSGQCGIADAVYATNIDNLCLIPVGETVKTPLALISSADFTSLIQKLREAFDMIIIDTPPIGVIIDAAEIASRCDGSIVVVENKKTHTKALKGAVARLKHGESPVLGCVLNKSSVRRLKYIKYIKYGDGSNGKSGILRRVFQKMRKQKQ